MANIEVIKERACIAGHFNLSACRNPENRALVALAVKRTRGECHIIPAAPSEKVADVFRCSRNVVRESTVIIVTEINGTFLFLLTCFTISSHDAMISKETFSEEGNPSWIMKVGVPRPKTRRW